MPAPLDPLSDYTFDAIIVQTIDGRIRSWNKGAARLYGYSSDQAIGRQSHELLGTRAPEELTQIAATLADHGSWEGVLQQTCADGRTAMVRSRWVAATDADGVDIVVQVDRDETERWHVVAELRASSQQLRFVTDHAPVMIAHCDAAGRYRFVNEAYAQRFGRAATDFTGRHIADILGPEVYARLTPYLQQVLAGKRAEFELSVSYPTLGPRVMHCVYEPELDDSGRAVGLVAAITDVTAHKSTEDALRVSRERLDFIVGSAEIGVWSCDLPFDQLLWNDACKKHFGLSPDASVTIQTFYDRLHPEDVEPTRQAVEGSIADGTVYDVEYRTLQADGSYRWVRALGRAHYGERGRPVRFDGITIDISPQKRAEALLREREAHFRAIADHVPAILWVTDPDGQCTYLTRQWYEFTGGSAGEDLGMDWLGRLHPDDVEETRQTFLSASARRTPFSLDYRLRRRDGTYRWGIVLGTPRFDTDGTFLGFVGTVVDVHERKMFEQALADTDRRKDEFLATLSHELRNPLAPLVTALRLLELADGDPATAGRARAIMKRQLTQMTKLVDDLLDVSRITRGKFQLRPERITVDDVLQSAIEASASVIADHGHSLTTSVPEAPVYLYGDPTRLAQVFLNLLNNAAKYTPKGGQIHVDALVEHDFVRVQVIDTGIGITPEMQATIFEMFVQDENSRSLSKGGLGIGLTLVKHLVDLHGGTVEVFSSGPDHGSVFTVRLPAAEAIVDERTIEDAEAPVADAPRRRVLIADDNRDARESLALLLGTLGHAVRTAADGVEALELGDAFEPDVVFLDIGMPRMNGYDAARQMRHRRWGESVLLVAMTGWGQPRDTKRSEAAGIDHHLSKPVDPDRVQGLLNEHPTPRRDRRASRPV